MSLRATGASSSITALTVASSARSLRTSATSSTTASRVAERTISTSSAEASASVGTVLTLAPMDQAPPDSLDRARKVVELVSTLVGVGLSVWLLYDMTKDNPLGPSAQVRWWWERRRQRSAHKRAELREVGLFALDLALYLDREVTAWKSTYPLK